MSKDSLCHVESNSNSVGMIGIKTPTRGLKILDVFITNVPNFWKSVKVVKSLVRSDHDMVITYPRNIVKAIRTNSYFRDVRQTSSIEYAS